MDIKCKDLHTDRLTDKINTLMFWTIKQIYFLFYFYKYLSYKYLSIFFEYNKLCKINISLSFVNINAVKPLTRKIKNQIFRNRGTNESNCIVPPKFFE